MLRFNWIINMVLPYKQIQINYIINLRILIYVFSKNALEIAYILLLCNNNWDEKYNKLFIYFFLLIRLIKIKVIDNNN